MDPRLTQQEFNLMVDRLYEINDYPDISDEEKQQAMTSYLDSVGFTPETWNSELSLQIDQAEQQPLTTSGALVQGISNLPASTLRLGKTVVDAVIHPIRTADSITKLGAGVLQEILPERFVQALGEDEESRELARSVGRHLAQQYGSLDNIKRAFAEDPAFVLADVSTVFGIGAGVTAGRAGTLSSRLASAERLTNPLYMTGRAVGLTGQGIGIAARELAGLATGTGGTPIREAFRVAIEGGEEAERFLGQLRNTDDLNVVVDSARTNLQALMRERNNQYLKSQEMLRGDATHLSFDSIQNVINTQKETLRRGDAVVDPETYQLVIDAEDAVKQWIAGNADELHTPFGIDGLKIRVGSILDKVTPGTNSYRVINNIYREIGNTIKQQAPSYAGMMRQYAEASDQIAEMQRTLSMRDFSRASFDAQLRKLMSTMRDNVNTNFGRRAQLLEELEEVGGQPLRAPLAGRALEPLVPTGLQRGVAGAGALADATGAINPYFLAGLAATSPRLVGTTAYGAGMLARYPTRARRLQQQYLPQATDPRYLNLLYQLGQVNQMQEQE